MGDPINLAVQDQMESHNRTSIDLVARWNAIPSYDKVYVGIQGNREDTEKEMCTHIFKQVNDVKVCIRCGFTIPHGGRPFFDKKIVAHCQHRGISGVSKTKS